MHALPGRTKAVLVQPQAFRDCVQFVLPASDLATLTLLIDTGTAVICVDAPRVKVGSAILAALKLVSPDHDFRLVPPLGPLRHGDVIKAFQDDAITFAVGGLQPPGTLSPAASWLSGADGLLLSAADMDLLQLRVPVRASPHSLKRALTAWLGRQRCLDVGLVRVDDPCSSQAVYCLPRRQASTLTVLVSDIASPGQYLFAQTLDGPTSAALGPQTLRTCPKYGAFWQDLLARQPAVLRVSDLPSPSTAHGAPHITLHLGLDVSRAQHFGWQFGATAPGRVFDLHAHSSSLGIHWSVLQDLDRTEAAVQTLPNVWPAQASPMGTSSVPRRKKARQCLPYLEGTVAESIFHLECSEMGVHCMVPCVPHWHIWALRIDDKVYGACTKEVTWGHVLQATGLSTWDAPHTIVQDGSTVWEWPDDISPLSGRCGNVFPYGLPRPEAFACGLKVNFAEPPSDSYRLEHMEVSSNGATRPYRLGPLICALWPWGARWLCVSTFLVSAAAMQPGGRRNREADPAFAGMYNSTPPCNVAWCHELACQTTHFSVTTRALSEYFQLHSPFEVVRVYLWLPFSGPVTFEVHRDEGAEGFTNLMSSAGHRPNHRLFVAFDSQAVSLDLLSVPPGQAIWWIVATGSPVSCCVPLPHGTRTKANWLLQSTPPVRLVQSHSHQRSLDSTGCRKGLEVPRQSPYGGSLVK